MMIKNSNIFAVLLLVAIFTGCATIEPQPVEVTVKPQPADTTVEPRIDESQAIDYDEIHDSLTAEYEELYAGYIEAILAEQWDEKQRIDKACADLFREAIDQYPESPYLSIYEEMLEGAKLAASQEKVDVDALREQLKNDAMSQLQSALEYYAQQNNGMLPESLGEALPEGMEDCEICPVHNVPYAYFPSNMTVQEVRSRYWVQLGGEGVYRSVGAAPLLVRCPSCGDSIQLLADLTIFRKANTVVVGAE